MAVEFRVLGPLEAFRDGHPIELGSPKQRALLISLLLRANRTVPIDRLIDELWPEGPAKGAKASLHSYVSRLRTALDDRDATVLRTRPGGYELVVAADATDVERFERASAEGRRHLADGDPAAARAALGRALASWRGEPLADVADQPFAQAEVVRLEQLRVTAQEDAVEALLAVGGHAEAVAELGPLIDANPLRERLRAQMVLALYRSGRQTEALDHVRGYRERLVDELGIEPGPDLQRLAEAVLQHDPDLEAPTTATATPTTGPAPSVSPDPAPGGRRPAARRLLGRDRELVVLDAALADATAGRGRVLLVGGEPGIGKTRLLEELADRAGDAGADVLWGRSHEGGGAPSFWPWTQILREVVERSDDETLAELVGDDAVTLTQLAPELGRRLDVGTPARSGDLDAERFGLFAAVGGLLDRLSARRPTVLVLEDLHWADGPSLELLAAAAQATQDRTVLIAASYRDLVAERSPELNVALASLARQAPVQHLTPLPLSRADVAAVLGEMLGDERAPAVAGIVHDRTDGNPFFVTEFGRLLQAEGIHPATAAAVPTGVHHVVQRRYRSLPEGSQRLLAVGAVGGRDFDLRVTALALDVGLDEVLEHVAPALEHGLVEETGRAVTSLRFVHALVRETILAELPRVRLAQLHRAVGDAMVRSGVGPDQVDEVAEHFWQAADLGEHERALEFALAAAETSERRTAHEQAERHLRRALELSGRSTGDQGTYLQVLERLADLLVRAHGYNAPGLADLITAAPAAPPGEPSDPRLVQLWHHLWSHHHSGGRFDLAADVAERLLAEAHARGDDAALVALGHFCAAASAAHRGRSAEAERHFGLARERLVGDLERFDITVSHLAVDIPMYHAVARAMVGACDDARRLSAEAIARAEALDRPFSRAMATLLGAWSDALLDDAVAARDRAASAVELCAEHGFQQYGEMAELVRSWATVRLGRPEGRADRMAAAVAALERNGTHAAGTFWRGLLADAHVRAGDLHAAIDAHGRARAVADANGERGFDAWLCRLEERLVASAPPTAAAGTPQPPR